MPKNPPLRNGASVLDADKSFRDVLHRTPGALEESFASLIAQGPLPLEGIEVTRAILLRLSTFYEAQQRVKEFLGKRYVGPAADFFVETVAFYLKALIVTHALDVEVASERQIRRSRGAMRPDISVWKGDRCLACIECKTQLGWNRHGWEAQFVEREQRLLADFSAASTFLVVLSARNWPGFGDNPHVGKKYFVLSTEWPTAIEFDRLEDFIGTAIEPLLAQVVGLATSSG